MPCTAPIAKAFSDITSIDSPASENELMPPAECSNYPSASRPLFAAGLSFRADFWATATHTSDCADFRAVRFSALASARPNIETALTENRHDSPIPPALRNTGRRVAVKTRHDKLPYGLTIMLRFRRPMLRSRANFISERTARCFSQIRRGFYTLLEMYYLISFLCCTEEGLIARLFYEALSLHLLWFDAYELMMISFLISTPPYAGASALCVKGA